LAITFENNISQRILKSVKQNTLYGPKGIRIIDLKETGFRLMS